MCLLMLQLPIGESELLSFQLSHLEVRTYMLYHSTKLINVFNFYILLLASYLMLFV